MPFTRIMLRQNYPEEKLRQLSEILHQALTEEFAVPAEDCFQVIEMLPASQLIFNRHYLSGTRSEDFVLFHILAGKQRSIEQKKNFYHALSRKLLAKFNIHPDNVMVIIQFNTAEDWSFSGGKMYIPEDLC